MMHQVHGNFIRTSTLATHILKFSFTLNVMWHMEHIVYCTCCVQSQVKNRKPFFRQASVNWSENFMQAAHIWASECTLRRQDRSTHHAFRHIKLIISRLIIKWKWQIDRTVLYSIDQLDIPHLFNVKCIWVAVFLLLYVYGNVYELSKTNIDNVDIC